MDIKKLDEAAELEKFGSFIADLSQSHAQMPMHDHGGDGSIETVREDDYEGHHIEIRTTYQITVDGEILMVPLGLDNNGILHCHALPNYQFDSAVDLVRRLIDNFPDDFKRKRAPKKSAGKQSAKKSSRKQTRRSHKHATKGGH